MINSNVLVHFNDKSGLKSFLLSATTINFESFPTSEGSLGDIKSNGLFTSINFKPFSSPRSILLL